MEPTYETDLAKLEKFIRLAEKPRSVRWQIFDKTTVDTGGIGPKDWGLVAVLEYDETTAQALQSQAAQSPMQRELYVNADFVRDWFPDSVRQSFVKDANSDYLKLTLPRYEPAAFAKSPLSDGYVAFSDKAVLLALHTV